jgi:hypothetical protein
MKVSGPTIENKVSRIMVKFDARIEDKETLDSESMKLGCYSHERMEVLLCSSHRSILDKIKDNGGKTYINSIYREKKKSYSGETEKFYFDTQYNIYARIEKMSREIDMSIEDLLRFIMMEMLA